MAWGAITWAVRVPVPVTVAEPLTSWIKTAVLPSWARVSGVRGGAESSPGADQRAALVALSLVRQVAVPPTSMVTGPTGFLTVMLAR